MPTLEELEARIVALEENRCACSTCQAKRAQRRQIAENARLWSVAKLPEGERMAGFEALSPADRRKLVTMLHTEQLVDYLRPLDAEARAKVLASGSQLQREFAAVWLMPAVERVRVRFAVEGAWSSFDVIALDEKQLTALWKVGFGKHEAVLGSGANGKAGKLEGLYLDHRPIGETRARWEARVELDARLRALVERGEILVENVRDEESRQMSFRDRDIPELA